MRLISKYAAALSFLLSATATAADDKTVYNERAAARTSVLFQSLDRDTDGVVTREESRGDLNFGPRFADMDINSDNKCDARGAAALYRSALRRAVRRTAVGSRVP